jgi:glycosyltransferase involved in cell wall biosynthesis
LKLSVLICTWNRAESLLRLLRSLIQAEPLRHADWEIVVVNNNCTDDTNTIVEELANVLPLNLVFEPKPGLSYARNTGVATAAGDYILWTDDDVTVGRKWLRAYESAFENLSEASVFGGPIIPRFEGKPPDWIEAAKQHMPNIYAGIDLGDKTIMLDSTSAVIPYGANMAIRGLEQRQFRYDTRLGLKPGRSNIRFEEYDVLKRILATGSIGWWIPDAVVQHWIPPARQTIDYIRDYFHGVGQIISWGGIELGQQDIGHKRTTLYLKAAKLEAIFRYHRAVSSPDKWLPALRSSSKAWGKLSGFNPVS